jgi:hypothetical protein
LSFAIVLTVNGPALACRYNVRDLGFIDVGDQPYRLYTYLAPDVSAEEVDAVQDMAQAALSESNIDFVLATAAGEPTPEAKAILQAHPDLQLPGAILVSPDGQTLRLKLSVGQAGWRQPLANQLQSLVESPNRDAITRLAAETFAVVLLLEGTNQEATQLARTAIDGAIEQIRMSMAWMPKAIARPPESVVLDHQSQKDEDVLLWSLGLDTESVPEPRAAVIYGRARWMGPIARGEEITEENLARLLAIIGVDCECGMDLSWTRGTRLPVRWGQAMYRQVAESLQFDPENPMVKIEASRILSRYGGLVQPTVGYSEISLAGSEEETTQPEVAVESTTVGPVATVAPPAELPPATSEDRQEATLFRRILLVGGSLGGCVLVVGAAILLRAWRRGRLSQ